MSKFLRDQNAALQRLLEKAERKIARLERQLAPRRGADWFSWVVRLDVHKTWVEDGFELTEPRARDMLAGTLSYADGSELGAKLIRSPDADRVAKMMGYDNAKDRKARNG